MTEIVETPLGRFRKVRRDEGPYWLWECPICKEWGGLDDDQFHGRISVNCAASGKCTYHETHDYAKALAEALA